jgi:GTP-binding protein
VKGLILEAENNVGITFGENENKDAFVISGRGELDVGNFINTNET